MNEYTCMLKAFTPHSALVTSGRAFIIAKKYTTVNK